MAEDQTSPAPQRILVLDDGADVAMNRFETEVWGHGKPAVFLKAASIGRTEIMAPFAYSLLNEPPYAPWRHQPWMHRASPPVQKHNPKRAAQKAARAARKAGRKARS